MQRSAALTVVVRRDVGGGAATHALVIGVGTYPWLLGGSKIEDPALADGMGQLASPSHSAAVVADWLAAEHHDPTAPLETVDLLVSQGGQPYVYVPPGSEPVEVGVATKAGVVDALQAWKQRGNGHEDNQLVFYFCGHGVTRGFETALLAADYASDPDNPFAGAIWFEGMKEGMRNCVARRLLFFVDACRVASGRLLAEHTTRLDQVLAARAPYTVGQARAAYYATVNGAPAYGVPGRESVFAGHLLRGLRGLAADDADGNWRVGTTGLQRVLSDLARRFAPPDQEGLQSPASGELADFHFHHLAEAPLVPLYLRPSWVEDDEAPPADVRTIALAREGETIVEWAAPWPAAGRCRWEGGRFRSDQPAGLRYAWTVTLTDGTSQSSAPKSLGPPYRIVEFPRDGIA